MLLLQYQSNKGLYSNSTIVDGSKHKQSRFCARHHLLYWTLYIQHYHCDSWAVGSSAAPGPIHPAVRLDADNLLLLREAFRMTPQAGDSRLLSLRSLSGRGQLVLPGVCHRDGASVDGVPVFLRRAVWLPCVREHGQVSLRASAGLPEWLSAQLVFEKLPCRLLSSSNCGTVLTPYRH